MPGCVQSCLDDRRTTLIVPVIMAGVSLAFSFLSVTGCQLVQIQPLLNGSLPVLEFGYLGYKDVDSDHGVNLPRTSTQWIGSCRRYPTDVWDVRVNVAVILHLVGLLASAAITFTLAISICRVCYINFYRTVGACMLLVSCSCQGLAFLALHPMCRDSAFMETFDLLDDYRNSCNLGPTTIYTFVATLGWLMTGYSCFQVGTKRPDRPRMLPSVKDSESATSVEPEPLASKITFLSHPPPHLDDALDRIVVIGDHHQHHEHNNHTHNVVVDMGDDDDDIVLVDDSNDNISDASNEVYTSYCMSSIGDDQQDAEERDLSTDWVPGLPNLTPDNILVDDYSYTNEGNMNTSNPPSATTTTTGEDQQQQQQQLLQPISELMTELQKTNGGPEWPESLQESAAKDNDPISPDNIAVDLLHNTDLASPPEPEPERDPGSIPVEELERSTGGGHAPEASSSPSSSIPAADEAIDPESQMPVSSESDSEGSKFALFSLSGSDPKSSSEAQQQQEPKTPIQPKSEYFAQDLQQTPTPETEGTIGETDNDDMESDESDHDEDDQMSNNFYYMSGPPASMGYLIHSKAPGRGPATLNLPDLPETDDEASLDSQLICLSDYSEDPPGSPQRTPSGRIIAADRRVGDASFFRFV